MIKLSKIKPNPANPRVIRDDKFQELVKSIKEFPEMLAARPVVVDDDWMVRGGNQRLKALMQLEYKEVPDEWIKKVSDFTPEQWHEFTIKDNVSFGQWDWGKLEGWNADSLNSWGLEVFKPSEVNLDDFFEEQTGEPDVAKKKIVLEYPDEDHEKVIEGLKAHGKTPEQAVFKLLEL